MNPNIFATLGSPGSYFKRSFYCKLRCVPAHVVILDDDDNDERVGGGGQKEERDVARYQHGVLRLAVRKLLPEPLVQNSLRLVSGYRRVAGEVTETTQPLSSKCI